MDPREFVKFEVVHCVGLLYHLESPIAALRHLNAMCRRLLVLETLICDSCNPVSILEDKTKAARHAIEGLGSRPSSAFLALALNRVGVDYVCDAAPPRRLPDFQFRWFDNLDTKRNSVLHRCVIVASRSPLEQSTLVPLLGS